MSIRNIIVNLIFSVCYILFYDYIYHNYIAQYFAYVGIVYRNPDMMSIIMFGAFPIVFYKGLQSIASAFSFFIYMFVYIPFIETLFVGGYDPGLAYPYIGVFFVSMCVFFMTDEIYCGKELFLKKRRQLIPFVWLEVITLLLFLYSVAVNYESFRFVNILTDSAVLYDLRAEYHEDAGRFNTYMISWLKHVLLPIVMVVNLQKTNIKKWALSFLAFFVMFMIDKQKITLLIPFVITACYFLVKLNGKAFKARFHKFMIAAFIIFPFLCMMFMSNTTISGIAAILIMRTQCIEGMELGTYLNFFEVTHHMFTYYSHVNIVNALTDLYPYNTSLGYAVTYGVGNANGTFWLMDGIAAWGVYGCAISSILFILFKSFFNSIGLRYDAGICIVVMLYAISAMINASLFTTLLTCGFLLFYLIYAFVDLESETNG